MYTLGHAQTQPQRFMKVNRVPLIETNRLFTHSCRVFATPNVSVYWCLPYLLVWKALVGVYWRNFRCYNYLSTGQSDKMEVAYALCLGYTNVIPWPTFKHTHKWYIFWHVIQLNVWQIPFQSDLSATLQYFKSINANSFKQTNNTTTWNIENLDYHRLWVQLFAWQLCLNIILHHLLKSHQIKPMDLGDLIDVCLLCLLNGRIELSNVPWWLL